MAARATTWGTIGRALGGAGVLALTLVSAPRAAHAKDGSPEPTAKSDPPPPPAAEAARASEEEERPSPLQVDYAQYGVALVGEVPVEDGALCPSDAITPCIIGPGGGPAIRGGYRPSGAWYFGGSYQFAKLDSNNLYRLGVLQTLRGEMRYYIDLGSRITPYVTWAAGGMVYGNEFGVETGGLNTFAGAGFELEITRFAVVGLNLVYEPMLFVGFEDSTGQARDTGISQFLHLELVVELRSELGRE